MFSGELQKRTLFFVAALAFIAVLLFLLPSLITSMGLARNAEGSLVPLPDVVYLKATLSFLDTGFRVVRLLIWLAVVVTIVRYINFLVFGAALRNSGEEDFSSLLRTVLTVIVYVVSFFIIFQTQFPSIELAPLFTGSAIIGIVVGLALQDTLGNLFSGIAIQADQSFQVGDIITIGERGKGTVESISWRGVKIRTFQNKLLVISNSVIGKEMLEIAPRGNLNARIVRFNTIYTTSPARVIQIAREATRQVENVSPKRRPKVRIWNLGDNGIDWEIKYWTIDYRRHNDTDALIRQRIWYAFERENIAFAYPTRTIYTAKQSEEEAVFVETADEICERINSIPIFAPLSTDETKKISDSCQIRVFAPSEPIIEAGRSGDSMFIIHRGLVNVQLTENGVVRNLSVLKPGEFFGEMSLFSGEPRTADVVAETETKVIEIRKRILAPILESNPELVKVIGEIIEERKALLESEDNLEQNVTDTEMSGPVFKIKRFFGLK